MRESLGNEIPDTAPYTEWLAIVGSIVVAVLVCAVLFSNGILTWEFSACAGRDTTAFWPFLHCTPAKTEVEMFFKSKAPEKDMNAAANAAEVNGKMVQQQHLVVEQVAASPPVPKAGMGSCIGFGMSIVGNIECKGQAQVFGRIEGELRASDLLISDGAQVEGSVIAQDVTVCGRVKGTIRAVRVKLQNGGGVEGDIFHRSLSIDEHSQFEGSSRRVENPIDSLSSVDPKGPQKKDMQSLAPAPLPSIDADLRRVERWFAQSCSQMTS